jgi:hypothetical protein
METAQKEKVYGYLFKVVLSLILLFCIYNVVSIFFLSPPRVKKLQSRISSAVNTIESNIRRAGPENMEEIIYEPQMVNKVKGSPLSKQIERTLIFAGPVKTKTEIAESKIVQYENIKEPANLEIVFKGLADDLAYINIRREIDGQWHEHGFPTKIGEIIGGERILGGKTLDFTTNYVLQDIVYKAQKPTTLMKNVVILNDSGEFAGTTMVTGETFMKSTSKIKYKDENGNTKELWLKESAKTIKAEEEEIVEDDKAKPAETEEGVAIDDAAKQKEISDKERKPFDEETEIIKSILQEVEIGIGLN